MWASNFCKEKEQNIKWRTVIFENMTMDDELQQLLKDRSGILSDTYPLHMLISSSLYVAIQLQCHVQYLC